MNWHMVTVAAFSFSSKLQIRSVHIHGRIGLRATRGRISSTTHSVGERPPDPASLESNHEYIEECVEKVLFEIR